MIEVKKEGVLLVKTDFAFENEGVLNPGAIEVNGIIHIFYRAVHKGNFSSIGHCRLFNPLSVLDRSETPVLIPQFEYESHGIEDPRIVKIEDLYYLTYTAYDGLNALGALAVSSDLIHFEKKGIMVPQISYDEFKQLTGSKYEINKKYIRYNDNHGNTEHYGKKILIWDKNVIFFPERINGKLYFLHRIKPEIQIARINEISDLTHEYWSDYLLHFDEHILLTSKYSHEVSYIGGGCPPIKTEKGWLLIYHSVHDTLGGYVYSACAALLDLENPYIEVARLPYPLFSPDHKWELIGEVNNVCFPTGAIVQDEILYIYYGAADEQIACASIHLEVLLNELLLNPAKHA
jgi:predicted GH43/DUF377 family glycosyl hydrolase